MTAARARCTAICGRSACSRSACSRAACIVCLKEEVMYAASPAYGDYRDVRESLGIASLPDRLLCLRCREDHVGPITRNFKWRVVGPYLQLSEQMMEDLLHDYRWEQERRVRALRVWMSANGEEATYGRLMRALIQADLTEQARNVALVLLRAHKPQPRLSLASDSTSADEYHTPPESPPRPPRRKIARHTQTEECHTLYRLRAAVSAASRTQLQGDGERVSNIYVPLPLPRARGDEQAVRAYLSTSLTVHPFRDSGTQTDDLPQHVQQPPSTVPAAFSPPTTVHFLQTTPHPAQTTPRSHQTTLHPLQFAPHNTHLHYNLEATGSYAHRQRQKKRVVLYLVVPVMAVLGVLILFIAITYAIVYAIKH